MLWQKWFSWSSSQWVPRVGDCHLLSRVGPQQGSSWLVSFGPTKSGQAGIRSQGKFLFLDQKMDRCETVLYSRDPQPFFGPRDWILERQCFLGLGVGVGRMVSGWFQHITFIIHSISIIILSAPLDYQALDPRSWGTLLLSTRSPQQAISRAALLKSYYGGKRAELSWVWRRHVAQGFGSQCQSSDSAHSLLRPSWIVVPFTALLHMPWAELWAWPFCTRNWSEWPVWGLCTCPTMRKWNYFLCPSTKGKKVRLYFITQILFLILGNFSWALLVTGGGMLAWSELSGRILESRGRWLAWITYFPTNVVDLQTVPYSFCLIAVEISTWKTNAEQNSYTVLSCCEVTCAWVVPFTVSFWATHWQVQCLEWW